MVKEYDIIIAGAGIAGVFAALKISKLAKKQKTCLVEFGRPPGKRRRQLEGWMGCFPTGNARLYKNNVDKAAKLIGEPLAIETNQEVINILRDYGPIKYVNCKSPSETALQRAQTFGFKVLTNNEYFQWKPENIHSFSKSIAEEIAETGKIDFVFDNEIYDIVRKNDKFIMITEEGEFSSDKLLLCLGRSGWRVTKKIFENFGMVKSDNIAQFGIRGELPSSYMKEWGNSHCTLVKRNLTIGPLSWFGSVIPEDHVDLVISAWRSNEDRWKTDKVAFSIILSDKFPNNGCFQTERLGKLAYILADNRIGKRRVYEYMHSPANVDLSFIPEYSWMRSKIQDIGNIFPGFPNKGSFYVPDIVPIIPKIQINPNLSTDIKGLYLAGESAGIFGIISAAITGTIAGNNIISRRQ